MEAYMSIPFSSYMFFQFDVGFLPLPRRFGDYICDDGISTYGMWDLGFNLRPRTRGNPPNFYVLGGIGMAFDDDLIGVRSREEEALLLYKASAGIDFQLSSIMCLTVEAGIIGTPSLGLSHNYKIGAAFTLPNLVLF